MSAGAFFMSFDGYDTSGFYDEMFETDGSPRASARLLFERLRSVGDSEVRRYQQSAEQALFRMGITFPRDLIFSAKSFREACIGLKPPKGTRCHITGTDLVRHSWPASLNPAKGSSR